MDEAAVLLGKELEISLVPGAGPELETQRVLETLLETGYLSVAR